MTVPYEPVLIGGRSVFVKFFAMPRQADDPKRIEGTFTLVGPEGVLTLDALVGPQGDPGTPSPIIRPEWGSLVTQVGDLPELATLEDADNGRAWYIDGEWHVYHEGEYHVIQGSIPGPVGATPDISVTAELIDADGAPVYGPIEVNESGPSTSPNFHIKIPGVQGPEGPASSIELASDYDDTVPAEHGDFLTYDGGVEKWKPSSPTLLSPKKYTIPHINFTDYEGSAGRQLIASLNIPAQEYDWYPDVVGHVRISRGNILSTAAVEVEVRIGPTGSGTGDTEPLCGLGPHDPTTMLFDSVTIIHILPHFSDSGEPGRAIAPDSPTGRVLAGEGKTIYVFLHKTGGSGSYKFTKSSAQLRVNVEPVAD